MNTGLPRRLRWTGCIVLVTGLLAAALAYWHADDRADLAARYRIVGGQVFADATPSRYQQDLDERMGGKAMVFIIAFDDWAASLLHGKRLAYSLGILSIVAAWLCFHVADSLAPESELLSKE